MDIIISSNQLDLIKGTTEMIRLLFPEFNIIDDQNNYNHKDNSFVGIYIEAKVVETQIRLDVSLEKNKLPCFATPQTVVEFIESITNPLEINNQTKRMAKLGCYHVLLKFTKKQPAPWGILTGIRPTKIVHRLIDQGLEKEQILEHLISGFCLDITKAELLTEVAFTQRKYLLSPTQAKKLISIYIGIPFCPTRCAYCSFPAYSLEKWGKLVEPFLTTLIKEIKGVRDILKGLELKVETIYIGGGTPTSLTPDQMAMLLKVVNENLLTDVTKEFTVEAGRPDTITEAMLKVLKEGGVNRISINPQSMQSKTLETIGRAHSPQDVTDKVAMARDLGFNNINMDIILGLPGETVVDVRKTMEALAEIQPENLTVHTMAIKRASKLNEARENFELPIDVEVSEMLAISQENAESLEMHPYYLYRQKQILGHLENVGYARPGFDCLYNIQMMEERQTILGLGVGSGSKFVKPSDWTLESMYNPKDPLNYLERIDELIQRKKDKLELALK